MGEERVKFWQRAAVHIRDGIELFLLPGLAWVLPWPWCMRLFRRLARWSWLYRSATERAMQQADAMGWLPKEPSQRQHWLWQRRLVTLLDHSDMYLWWRKGRGGLNDRMDVEGTWPTPGEAALLCTFHWGTGMWGLVHAAQHLGAAHALVAPLNAAHFVGRPLLWRYARWRTRAVGNALRAPPLDISKSLKPALLALRDRSALMAAVDVPADAAEASMTLRLLDRDIQVPRALFRLAVQQQIPMYVYITGFDEQTGRKWLRIWRMPLATDIQVLGQSAFDRLDQLIRSQPAAWHFWSEAPRIFAQPAR